MNNTIINNILKYSIITGLAIISFIPLYVANGLFFPFITGKAFAFRIIVEIVALLWVILVLREKGTSTAGTDKSVAPRINYVTISVTLFTLIVLIADLLGFNPLRSIWSNFERMEGWMTIVHLWAYFIVLSSVLGVELEGRKNWHRFLNITLVAALITAFYGLFQLFGWAEVHQSASRLDASLGNAAYMAVYMLIASFISIYMAFTSHAHKLAVRGSADILVWVYSILSVFFAFIIFETATRGTIIGWVGGIMIAAAIYAIFGRKEKGQSDITRYIAGGSILFVIIVGVLFYSNKNAKFIQNNQTLSRMAAISIADTKTQGRAFIWPVAIKETFSTPKSAIIGIGQENFNYYFNKDYNPLMYGQEQWFDRAHSVFIDWLVATGLIGLIAYLALYLISLIYIWKSNLTLGQKSVLIALLAGYGIHNVFVFDNQTSYVMFFTILAFIHSLKTTKIPAILHDTKKHISEDYMTVRDYIVVPVLILIFATGFYFINVRNIQANTRLISALRACSNGSTPSITLFENVLSLNQTTANQEAREQVLSCASNVLGSDKVPNQMKSDFYALAKKEIEAQIANTPNDARMYVIGGSFFNQIGDLKSSLPLLEKAHELTPGKQTVDFDLATVYMNTGRSQDAVNITKSAYESAPSYETAKIAYITALVSNDQEKLAHELFPNDDAIFMDQRIISIYAQKKQYKKVIEIYKKLVVQKPDDAQTHYFLAASYIADKQNWQGIQELKAIAKQFPETKTQIDDLIKQIEEGKQL